MQISIFHRASSHRLASNSALGAPLCPNDSKCHFRAAVVARLFRPEASSPPPPSALVFACVKQTGCRANSDAAADVNGSHLLQDELETWAYPVTSRPNGSGAPLGLVSQEGRHLPSVSGVHYSGQAGNAIKRRGSNDSVRDQDWPKRRRGQAKQDKTFI